MTPTSRETKKEVPSPEDILHQPLSSLNIELSRISAEIQSINSGFEAMMQQVIVQVRESISNEYRIRMEKSLNEMREQIRIEADEESRRVFEAELRSRIENLGGVEKEIERVRAQIEGVTKEISEMLDDPSIELSKVMRKRSEQAELKAYLDGLRFSIGDQAKTKAAGR